MGTAHPIPGGDLCITSDEAFHLKELPKRILIAGGGYIALEFAHIFTVWAPGVAGLSRRQAPARLRRRHARCFVRIDEATRTGSVVGCEFAKVESTAIACTPKPTRARRSNATRSCWRSAACPTLWRCMSKRRCRAGKRGEVKVDEYSRTSAPHIYAVGDVRPLQLTPVAIHEAMCFVETAFKDNPPGPITSMSPAGVHHPELAAVGLTEAKALAKGHAIDVYKSTFKPLLHTWGAGPCVLT